LLLHLQTGAAPDVRGVLFALVVFDLTPTRWVMIRRRVRLPVRNVNIAGAAITALAPTR